MCGTTRRWRASSRRLKTARTARRTYRTRDEARADVFNYIERFYNPPRRHPTLGYLSPVGFENRAQLA
jgi:putative transposase